MRARYQAVLLDDMHIVLDLDDDLYCAIPASRGSETSILRELALHLSADPSDVERWPGSYPRDRPIVADLGPREADGRSDRPRLADWLALVPTLVIAYIDLRWRAPRHWLRPSGLDPSERAAVIAAARRFRVMRPFVPGLARCLPHALALRTFLALRGHPSTLVIGVRVFPFDAHSWVEADGVVLTDDLERLQGFTAIVAG